MAFGVKASSSSGLVMTACVLMLMMMILVEVASAQNWRGNYCSRNKCRYRTRRVCSYRTWFGCCGYKIINEAYWVTEYFCCSGWSHSGDYNCNDPICNPPCQNGGVCDQPGVCDCPSTHIGYRCATAVCSYQSPCFPGECYDNDLCQCNTGFKTVPAANKPEYCLTIEDQGENTNLNLTEMQVRMSYWPNYANPAMEVHWIMADSTDLEEGQMDVFWTNRRGFNRLETTCTSQYLPPELTDLPPYVSQAEFGVVAGKIEVWLIKMSRDPDEDGYQSLNKTIPCEESVSSTDPETNVFNCSVEDRHFDRLLEHRDALKITFDSTGGGYRRLLNTDTGSTYSTQSFEGVSRTLAVEFRFDFLLPYHCQEIGNCAGNEVMLRVPDILTANPLTIEWGGWVDDDSQIFRFAWEVFRMTRTTDGGVEIIPALALSPLINQEVMADDYSPQNYQLLEPGMYSVILEAGDRANNTKYVRRLVLFDPNPTITSDPQHDFYVITASETAGYRYQIDVTAAITVTWDRHFRNALHEEENLLGAVRQYPAELKDDMTNEGVTVYYKTIDRDSVLDDHEGQRTVDAIPNERGIVQFFLLHTKDSNGGKDQPLEPSPSLGPWIDLDLNTAFTLPHDPGLTDADTVTVWVKATDVTGAWRVERNQVSFDSSPPNVQGGIVFLMNEHVEGIHFSSQFKIQTEDRQSGIALIAWTFTLVNNGTAIYRETVHGRQECEDFTQCSCTKSDECFNYEQVFSISNCHMMVEKAKLATAIINVTADVTNMAGLVTTISMLKEDLTLLNGTEAYYPPQNITAKDITKSSVTLTWSFPPSCFARTGLWVIVNDVHHAVHRDAKEFALTGLSSGKAYTIHLVTDYVGDEQSEPAAIKFTTDDDPFPVGAIIGIIIGFLLLAAIIALIVIFVLWRRGKIFQKEDSQANRQMQRVSRAFTHVRTTVRGMGKAKGDAESGAFQNNAYNPNPPDQDELYMYGSMAFNTRQKWQLDDSSLTLINQLRTGRFATIYKATWTNQGKQETVAVKMLQAGFSEDDALKMMAKINFMATQLEDHPNVIGFLGAVTDNPGWGPVMVMEFCETGQLDEWLVANRADVTEQVMENLFRFSLGIAKGMQYIASQKIVHKRLAARNVLLNFLLEPKVAGFGPQQKEGTDGKATRIPAKWAAPEVLQDKTPTEKSDVWSYGIVLWEIFSMGQVPYPGIHGGEIGTQLKNGYRMDKPEFADDECYGVMGECWQYKPSKRPTFATLHAKLNRLYASGNRQSTDFYYDSSQLHH